MSTRISGLLFNVGEELPCQREDGNRADPFAVAVVNRWPHSEEDVISLLSLSTPGRLNRLSSNRIQTLVWGFSARGLEIPCVPVLCSLC